jgi:hypothetical protein
MSGWPAPSGDNERIESDACTLCDDRLLIITAMAKEPARDPFLRMHAVNVYVRDQERSLRFFLDKLGFQVAFDARVESGQRLVAVAPPDGTANGTVAASDSAAPRDCGASPMKRWHLRPRRRGPHPTTTRRRHGALVCQFVGTRRFSASKKSTNTTILGVVAARPSAACSLINRNRPSPATSY